MIERTANQPTREAYSVLWRRVLADPTLRHRLMEFLIDGADARKEDVPSDGDMEQRKAA